MHTLGADTAETCVETLMKGQERCSEIYLRVRLREHGLKESKTISEGLVEVGEVNKDLALWDCEN